MVMNGLRSAAGLSTVGFGPWEEGILTQVDTRERGRVAAVVTKNPKEQASVFLIQQHSTLRDYA